MNKKKIFFYFMLLVIISLTQGNENDNFIGVWCVDSQYRKIDDFLIIKKIENTYLVIVADVDDKAVNKGIGKRIDNDTLEYEMWGNKYTLDWFKDEEGEWIEEYIDHRMEEYPIYERVENFSIDKF